MKIQFKQETQYSSELKKIFNNSKDCWFVKIPPVFKGFPDLIGCNEGRFIGIEVKMQKGILSQPQMKYLEKIYSVGGMSLVMAGVYGGDGKLYHLIYKWPVMHPHITIEHTNDFTFDLLKQEINRFNSMLLFNTPDNVQLFDRLIDTTCTFLISSKLQIDN